ncbi:MAG: hypothetical protein GKR77_01015 [Legionellales bacterium]|nr:hypothetical protein [Legionellales bacterium]
MSQRSATPISFKTYMDDRDYKICDFPHTLLNYCQSLVSSPTDELATNWQWVTDDQKSQTDGLPSSSTQASAPANQPEDIIPLANQYVDYLADIVAGEYEDKQASHFNRVNILTNMTTDEKSEDSLIFGATFIPYYRESTIVRRLNMIEQQSNGIPRHLQSYEKRSKRYANENPNSLWAKVIDVLNNNQLLIKLSQMFFSLQNHQIDTSDTVNAIQKHMPLLETALTKLNTCLDQSRTVNTEKTVEKQKNSSRFYSIDEKTLADLTDKQLITICLDECNDPPTDLLKTIFQSHWDRVETAYTENLDKLRGRTDNPQSKIEALRNQQKQYLLDNPSSAQHIKHTRTEALPNQQKQYLPDNSSSAQHIKHTRTTASLYSETVAQTTTANILAATLLLILTGTITPLMGILTAGIIIVLFTGFFCHDDAPIADNTSTLSPKP